MNAARDELADYGNKGQSWNPAFVSYMVEMVNHSTYSNMPDAIKDDGKIQWEAPSNRKSGLYQHTHQKRRDWWRNKALSIGIDPTTDKWISKVAKLIHPTGKKPCKKCGRIMRIAYAYPNNRLRGSLLKKFGSELTFDPLESINDIVKRVADQYGVGYLSEFSHMLKTSNVAPPNNLCSIDDWLSWLDNEYIPSEPSLLSPGAMSNAPDRFDGFHSFNLCCRKRADTGRHDDNMRLYTTDRRVFEHWSDGDWIAADRMMGLISARFRSESCADGGDGPPTADHIGPLSLGFSHQPYFRLLSRSANAAKNNRMTLQDVKDLRTIESAGVQITSWYTKSLWDLRHRDVRDEELALRLSKVLRDNQRTAMRLLVEVYRAGHVTFLATLLNLEHADFNVDFENLRVEDFVTKFDRLTHSRRKTKYTSKQKARRLRIAFEALRTYGEKVNRHTSVVESVLSESVYSTLDDALKVLSKQNSSEMVLNYALRVSLDEPDKDAAEQGLWDFADSIPHLRDVDAFVKAKMFLEKCMNVIASNFSSMWCSERYVRSSFEDIDSE